MDERQIISMWELDLIILAAEHTKIVQVAAAFCFVSLGSTFEPLCHIIRLTLSIGAARRDGRPDKGKGKRKGGKRQNQN